MTRRDRDREMIRRVLTHRDRHREGKIGQPDCNFPPSAGSRVRRDGYAARVGNNGPALYVFSPMHVPCLVCLGPGLGNEMREKVWLTACQHSQHITIQLILCTLRENLWRPLIVLVSRMM